MRSVRIFLLHTISIVLVFVGGHGLLQKNKSVAFVASIDLILGEKATYTITYAEFLGDLYYGTGKFDDQTTTKSVLVTLNPNGGAGGTPVVIAQLGEAMPQAIAPTRSSYTFAGFFDTINQTGGTQYYDKYMNSAKDWDREEATTLYARWVKNNIVVTLNANGGAGGTRTVTAQLGQAMPKATAPIRQGYVFGGYFDTINSTGGTKYYDSDMSSAKNWDKENDTALYARWTLSQITVVVTLDPNGGEGEKLTYTATIGQSMPNAVAPVRQDYGFLGYFDTYNQAGGKMYYDSQMNSARNWDKDENTTLYARWEKKEQPKVDTTDLFYKDLITIGAVLIGSLLGMIIFVLVVKKKEKSW